MSSETEVSKWSSRKIRRKVRYFREERDKLIKDFKAISLPKNLAHRFGDGHPFLNCRKDSEDEIIEEFHTILDLSLTDLIEALRRETYNPYTVLCAYVWRALNINSELNCITQVIDGAFEMAKKLDYEVSKKPLHGVPFSVKSSFALKGYPITLGLGDRVRPLQKETCPLVAYLVEQGAVPFCLTNVPQGLLSYVTSNPLHGVTLNPWDYDRTPGGSSGGEAALVAAGGSPFGVGSDLGGSLRIPAAFCGVVTLKPTQDRLYTTHTSPGVPGLSRLGLSHGFITKCVADQMTLLNLTVGRPNYRQLCPISSPSMMNLRARPDIKYSCIGWFVDDGFQRVAPSSAQAVINTVAMLKEKGCTVKKLHLDKIEGYSGHHMASMFFKNALLDNGSYMAKMYKKEPSHPHLSSFIWLINWKRNIFVRAITSIGMTLIERIHSKLFGTLARSHNENVSDVRKNQEATDEFRWKFLRHLRHNSIDAIICPAFITPAQEFAYPAKLMTGTYLTGLFNMLDCPAGIVPVGLVEEDHITMLNNFEYFPQRTRDSLVKMQRKTLEKTEGLPNAVQVVTAPNEEEKCLQVMEAIEQEMSNHVQRLRWRDTSLASTQGTRSWGRWKSEDRFERLPNPVTKQFHVNPSNLDVNDVAWQPDPLPVIQAAAQQEPAAETPPISARSLVAHDEVMVRGDMAERISEQEEFKG